MKKDSTKNMSTLEIFGGVEDATFNVPTPTIVSKRIEKMAIDNGLDYIDAVLLYCDESGIDPEDIGKLINKSLQEKIRVEAMEKNFLKKENTLPI